MDKYDFIKKLDNALEPLSEPERESALNYYKELFEDSENEAELIEHLGSPEKIAENIIKESGMISSQKSESTESEEKTKWKQKFQKLTEDKIFLIIIAISAIILITSLEDVIIPLSAIAAAVMIVFILKNKGKTKEEKHQKSEYSDNNDDFGISEKKTIHEKSRSGNQLLLIILLIIFSSPVWIGFIAAALGILIAIIATILALTIVFGTVGIALFFTGISIILSPAFAAGMALTGFGLIFIGIVILAFIPLCSLTFKFCKWLFTSFISLLHSIFYTKEVVA